MTPSGGGGYTLMKVKNFWWLNFTKGSGETITWKAGRVHGSGDDN